MLRLLWGAVLGLVVGGAVAALAVKVLGFATLTALVAYPLAVLVGLMVGLVAGKPIWAKGAAVEAGLKAFFGALLAVGMMYALRTWVTFPLDLTSLELGSGIAGHLAATTFPAIAVVLALLFEADNLIGKSPDETVTKKRVASTGDDKKARIETGSREETELETGSAPAARKRR